ncbi:uncharacterized protein BCR38DRAFT_490986 [Pseudomassariella vexata]|uniref:Uncharacterized protein n=1 Tax=Pseudomassariella vexata TaxID=1141098 RepID=A0A1Y2DAF8_9PEZI|nr:uncharacterized protein BCR38DRAFT_490986 [Pseudomassariella vexata]ORY55645.1 hypothetical protein BCR38DRAFT_490986 [Pseudomassariella vexata]
MDTPEDPSYRMTSLSRRIPFAFGDTRRKRHGSVDTMTSQSSGTSVAPSVDSGHYSMTPSVTSFSRESVCERDHEHMRIVMYDRNLMNRKLEKYVTRNQQLEEELQSAKVHICAQAAEIESLKVQLETVHPPHNEPRYNKPLPTPPKTPDRAQAEEEYLESAADETAINSDTLTTQLPDARDEIRILQAAHSETSKSLHEQIDTNLLLLDELCSMKERLTTQLERAEAMETTLAATQATLDEMKDENERLQRQSMIPMRIRKQSMTFETDSRLAAAQAAAEELRERNIRLQKEMADTLPGELKSKLNAAQSTIEDLRSRNERLQEQVAESMHVRNQLNDMQEQNRRLRKKLVPISDPINTPLATRFTKMMDELEHARVPRDDEKCFEFFENILRMHTRMNGIAAVALKTLEIISDETTFMKLPRQGLEVADQIANLGVWMLERRWPREFRRKPLERSKTVNF